MNIIAGQGPTRSINCDEATYTWAGFNNNSGQSPGRGEIDCYAASSAHHNFDGTTVSIRHSIDIASPFLELVSFRGYSSQCNHCIIGICRSAAKWGIICDTTPALGIADDRQFPSPSSAGYRRDCQRYHESRNCQQNDPQNEQANLPDLRHLFVSLAKGTESKMPMALYYRTMQPHMTRTVAPSVEWESG